MTAATIFRSATLTRDPAKDVGGGDGGAALGDLPEWDLSDLYPGMDSPELTGDIKRIEAEWARRYGNSQ